MAKLKKVKSSKKLSFSDVGLEPKPIFELDDLSYKQRKRKNKRNSLDSDENEKSEKETKLMTKSELKKAEKKRKSLNKGKTKLEQQSITTENNDLKMQRELSINNGIRKDISHSYKDINEDKEVKSNSYLSLEDSFKSVSEFNNSSFDTDSDECSSSEDEECLDKVDENEEVNDNKEVLNDSYENLFDEILDDKVKNEKELESLKKSNQIVEELQENKEKLLQVEVEEEKIIDQVRNENNENVIQIATNTSLDDMDLSTKKEENQDNIQTAVSKSEISSPKKFSKRKMLYSLANSVWDYVKPVSLDELEKKQSETKNKEDHHSIEKVNNMEKEVDKNNIHQNSGNLVIDELKLDPLEVVMKKSKSQEIISHLINHENIDNEGVQSNNITKLSNSHNGSVISTPIRKSKRQMIYNFANSIWDYVKPVSLDELEERNKTNNDLSNDFNKQTSIEFNSNDNNNNYYYNNFLNDEVSDSEFYIQDSEKEENNNEEFIQEMVTIEENNLNKEQHEVEKEKEIENIQLYKTDHEEIEKVNTQEQVHFPNVESISKEETYIEDRILQQEDELEINVENQVKDQVETKLEDELQANIEDQVEFKAENQEKDQVKVEEHVKDQVEIEVEEKVDVQLKDNVKNELLEDKVEENIENQLKDNEENQVKDKQENELQVQVEENVENQIKVNEEYELENKSQGENQILNLTVNQGKNVQEEKIVEKENNSDEYIKQEQINIINSETQLNQNSIDLIINPAEEQQINSKELGIVENKEQIHIDSSHFEKILQEVSKDSNLIMDQLNQINQIKNQDQSNIIQIPEIPEIHEIQEIIDSNYNNSKERNEKFDNQTNDLTSQRMVEMMQDEILNTNLNIDDYDELFDNLHTRTSQNTDEYNMNSLDHNTLSVNPENIIQLKDKSLNQPIENIHKNHHHLYHQVNIQEIDDSLFLSLSSDQFQSESTLLISDNKLKDNQNFIHSFQALECYSEDSEIIQNTNLETEILKKHQKQYKVNKNKFYNKLYKIENKFNRKVKQELNKISQFQQEIHKVEKYIDWNVTSVDIITKPTEFKEKPNNQVIKFLVKEEIITPIQENIESKIFINASVNTEIPQKINYYHEKGVNTNLDQLDEIITRNIEIPKTSQFLEKDKKVDSIFKNEIYKILDNTKLVKKGQGLKSGYANNEQQDKEINQKIKNYSNSNIKREKYVKPGNNRYDIITQNNRFTKDYPESNSDESIKVFNLKNKIQTDIHSTCIKNEKNGQLFTNHNIQEYNYKNNSNHTSPRSLSPTSNNNYYYSYLLASHSPPSSYSNTRVLINNNNNNVNSSSYYYNGGNTQLNYPGYIIQPNRFSNELRESNRHINYYCGRSGGSEEVKRYMYVDGNTNRNQKSYYFCPSSPSKA